MAILLRLICIFCLLLALTSIAWGACLRLTNLGGSPGEDRFLSLTPVEGPYPLVFYLLAQRAYFFHCGHGYGRNGMLKWEDLEPVVYLGELRLEGSGRVTFAPPDGPQPLEEKWIRALLAERPIRESPQEAWEDLEFFLDRIDGSGSVGIVVLMAAPGQMPPPGYRPEILTPPETGKWHVPISLESIANPLPGMRVFTERFYEYTDGQRRK